MKCPKCQFENPEDVNFCVECGSKIEITCPNCGCSNSVSHKFCGGCGHKLSFSSETPPKDLSFDEKLTKIQKYLPKGLTDKILSQKDRIEGERKLVTVMFCDMEGYTPLTEKLGSEDAYNVMDQIYEILIHKVHDYEGTVNEMTGDGILALFGAPIALEDAPQRAIRSAYAIHKEMREFSEKRKKEDKNMPPLKMRIGIHTGPVVVGTLGNDLRVEFKAVGDTVNLSSRIESLAEPGTTYVSEETYKLAQGLFLFEALGERQVKGKDKPIRLYRVLETSTRKTRFDVSAERGLTPIVGREREMDLLIDAYERVKAGRGQAVSIVSEAGVGKSRLLYEFKKAIVNENVTFLEGRCLSYCKNVSYHPVADALRSNFDIQEKEDDLTICDKVKKGLNKLAVDESSTLPYILELFSVKDSGIDKIPMSPDAKRQRIAGALNQIVQKGAKIRPLILAFEDLHWIDESSKESIKSLLENIAGSRIFLVLTYRPEFDGAWGARSYQSQVNLNRLPNRTSLEMLTNLLGTENIAGDLTEMILQKTEGVPFFIEEFVKSLKNLKIITMTDSHYRLVKDVQSVAIPSTIQDVIMARVDSLSEGSKEVIQTGSVIEREFSYELIKQVIGLPDSELTEHFLTLKDSELLYERGINPETTYIFNHALTREVIYGSILSKNRKKLHNKIAKALEETSKDTLGEHLAALANHFIKAENYEKGAKYAKLTRKRAQRAGSFTDAIEYARQRLVCLERLPKTEANQKNIIDERTAIAAYYMNLGKMYDAYQSIKPVVNIAMKLNYERRLSGIYTVMALFNFYTEENYPEGFRYIKESLECSEKKNDYISFWMSNYFLGALLSWNCEFDKGLDCLKKCEDLSELAKNPVGISNTKSNMAVNNYVTCGNIDQAYETGAAALRVAKETNDILSEGLAHVSFGLACYHKGLFSEAENCLLTGVKICEQISQVMWMDVGYHGLGLLYFDTRKYKNAEKFFKKAIYTTRGAKIIPSWIRYWELCLARIAVIDNVRDIHPDELIENYGNTEIKFLEGQIANCIGDIFINIDNQHLNEAEEWIAKAIGADSKNGTIFSLGQDYALYAELNQRKGNLPAARENLRKAIEIFRNCGANGWVEKYEKELAAIA